jgi:pimeloyl-ACP methyl ester carboxylesterase
MPHKVLEKYKQHALFMEVDGIKIAYWMNQWQEDKPHLSFLHGFPSASWDWHNQWRVLERNYNLLAFDFLGFGLSDKPTNIKYSLAEQADLQVRLWRHLRVVKSHIVAHDYGVSVAQELLRREQQQEINTELQSILFLNGGLFPESHRPLLTQKILASVFGGLVAKFIGKAKLENSFKKIFGRDSQPSAEDIDVLWSLLQVHNGMKAMPSILAYIKERSVYRDQWVNAMEANQHKIGFVNGIQDPISGLHMLDQFKRLLPKAANMPLDVGHYPQIEAPELITQAITIFTDSQGASLKAR